MKLKPKASLFGGIATYRGWNIGYSDVLRTHYAHNRADFDDFIFGSLRRLKVAIKARNIAKPELDPINDPKSKYYQSNPFDVNVAGDLDGLMGNPKGTEYTLVFENAIDKAVDAAASALNVPRRMIDTSGYKPEPQMQEYLGNER